MNTIIYYFTGTGNSLYIARETACYLGDCEIVPMAKLINEECIECNYDKVGIIFPIYYGGLPKFVLEFMNKLKVKEDTYVFAISTKGGTEGVPMKQIDSILKKQNNKLSFSHYVTMPDNYIKIYKVKDDEYIKNLIEKEKRILLRELNLVKDNKIKPIKKGLYYYTISPLYKSFIRSVNFKDQKLVIDGNCTRCGLCQKICPVDNIYLVNGFPSWKHQCQQCMACIQACPKRSINIGKKTVNRKRYINPYVHVNDIINQKR